MIRLGLNLNIPVVKNEVVFDEFYDLMNYLAHIYLSGESEQIQLGNFIGDYVKGNRYADYPDGIRQGILLHRHIDHFTDHHPVVQDCNSLLRSGYGKHAGIVTDIFFDHFLASKWSDYSNDQLLSFTRRFHAVLLHHFTLLPTRVKLFLPFMIQHKRLYSYAELSGIERSLLIMGQRTSLPENSAYAIDLLKREYAFLSSAFGEFFSELIEYVEAEGGYRISRPHSNHRDGDL